MSRLCELRDAPLSVDEVARAVSRPSAGGTAVFIGSVRDHSGGQAVTELEYSAYPSMAVKQMSVIIDALEAELGDVQLAIVHRVGRLAIGDLAVVCAASASHRGLAFQACQLLIDLVKEEVPIWKREHGPNGPHWVGWQDARS